jgi:hypothetical protein
LEDAQAKDREFLLVAAIGGDVPAVAVEDDLGAAVPGLDDVESLLDLALKCPLAEVAAEEDRLLPSSIIAW